MLTLAAAAILKANARDEAKALALATQVARETASDAESLGIGEMSAAQSALGQLLTQRNTIEINMAISAAGRASQRSPDRVVHAERHPTRRILDAMGHAELQQEIFTLTASDAIPDRRLAQDLGRRRDWLRERVRDYVEHQFLLHADVTGRRLRESLLRNLRLSTLEQRHHRLLQDLVHRMARKLVAAYFAAGERYFVAASCTCPARCAGT